jgi:hypothetical protein
LTLILFLTWILLLTLIRAGGQETIQSQRSEAPQRFVEGHGFSRAVTRINLDGFSR